ncbi:Major facilitator superfamily protein [Forsythia ovata]|uniref:Major facilitator superfamily protein n=1 Tax=Forsythia ovata TaxID=205694 RepID=A0ABD1QUA4_9LAMI
MVGESRKWLILVASIWIQAFTGTNFVFSSYSTSLKSVMGISQVQLNYLSVASDMGKAFGWCSGISLLYFPLWLVMFIAAFMGLIGYGLQWLVIQKIIFLPYFLVFLLCLLAGCSICWFNTVCYVLCIKFFPANRPLALSLSVSFNGVSAALYNLIVNSINPNDDTLYLLLNAIAPLITSLVALLSIARQHIPDALPPDAARSEMVIFLYLTALAVVTGLYLLLLNSLSLNASIAPILLAGAMFLLFLPLITPGILYAQKWASRTIHSSFNLIDNDDFEVHRELMESETPCTDDILNSGSYNSKEKEGSCKNLLFKDNLMVLGEEHSARFLIHRWDFWLYYIAYLCGGTIGLVYSNNLGQISESLGYNTEVSTLVSLYSGCSFFGRLLATTPDLHEKTCYPRTGWLALALVPTTIAFLLLSLSGSKTALVASTSLIGLSSGFVFSVAVSITSELFGPNSAGVNHNILITNIPLGSLLYGLLAALVYEANIGNSNEAVLKDGRMVCMGRNCYFETFVWWGCISLFGLASSSLLFLRTKAGYECFTKHKRKTSFQLLTT